MSSYLTSGIPSAFPNVTIVSATIGSATINQSGITMGSGKQLTLGQDATESKQAVTLDQLNALNTNLQGAINQIAGTDTAFDTLAEMKTFIDGVTESGADNLLSAINNEVSARAAAISTEQTARAAAIDNEASTRATAIDNEASTRAAAIDNEASTRATAIIAEQTARAAAISAEASTRAAAISTEQTARAAAIDNEASARAIAINAEASTRAAAITNEASARDAADTSLSNRLYRHVNIQLTDGILGLAAAPIPMPTAAREKSVVDGWYFKNPGPSVASNLRKFNWYFGAPVDQSTGVATGESFKEINMPVTIISKVSTPFITVYTATKGINDETNWYHAKYTYVCNTPLTPFHNDFPNYNFRVLISGDSLVGKVNNHKNVDLVLSSVAGSSTPNSTLSPNDVILFVAIGSDSGSAAGNVECIVHGCNFLSSHHNVEYHLTNRDVVQKYMLHKIAEVFKTLGQQDPSIGLL